MHNVLDTLLVFLDFLYSVMYNILIKILFEEKMYHYGFLCFC